ncbi:unnamed protein product (macronuclear) [Paramecium tetraurelia]|uniref:Cell division cycle protein 123 homolog n=1 Tax=Paramecium tetraurelia TaxID=5888 RepID=A0DI03_PARTE|nr:uncharacterized protein GSPATT00017041001 [Paramecium tetraurelia]CAK82670.1 unnamed protein product [Paramecium tetraurelia]|eukprot:XP_001450067.1 hypothetical protein (macronuclear) [Paramecium tetraurelia strain d4-2]
MNNNMNQFCRVNWPKGLKSFKSKSIRLSQEVVSYLKEDGILLNDVWKRPPLQDNGTKRFPELEQLVNEILDDFESVFIKLNWRAPLDCQNTFQDMCFQDLYDIMMALKYSGVIMEMIEDYDEQVIDQNHPEKCQLVAQPSQGYLLELKKYYKLRPNAEFRCFVKNKKLIGISQKNLYLITEDESVKDKIQNYFNKIVDLIEIDNYVLDVYIDIPPKENIILVDLNPWQEHTRPKLFTYEELDIFQECQLRLVKNKDMIVQEDYSGYRESVDIETLIQQQQQEKQQLQQQ